MQVILTHARRAQVLLYGLLVLALAFGAAPGGAQAAPRPASTVLTAVVFNGGNIRQEASLKGKVLGQLQAHQTVTLLEKTRPGTWYRVVAPEATGWVSASLLTIDAGVAAQVPVEGAAPAPAPASDPIVPWAVNIYVTHGGNMRDSHGMQGKVIGLVQAGDTVQAVARCNKDLWIEVVDGRGTVGWVHKSLLNIDAATIASLPID